MKVLLGAREQLFRFFHELGYTVSLVAYYLKALLPLIMDTLLYLSQYRFEYQFIAWRYPENATAATVYPQ